MKVKTLTGIVVLLRVEQKWYFYQGVRRPVGRVGFPVKNLKKSHAKNLKENIAFRHFLQGVPSRAASGLQIQFPWERP